jgi:lipoprotein-anchoring transpeptidase ErfK/SrfK
VRIRRLAAVTTAGGIAILALGLLTGCSSSASGSNPVSMAPLTTAGPATTDPAATGATSPSAGSSAPPKTSAPAGRPVTVSALQTDGATYGVGMPIVVWFNVAPTDVTAFDRATTVLVNGAPASGSWYWQKSAHPGAAIEAHYRPRAYWTAHARIEVSLAVKGLTAGPGLVFGNDISLSMSTGAATIGTVDAQAHTITVSSDGTAVGTFGVSLGATATPTRKGVKVIMQKFPQLAVGLPGGGTAQVQYAQRLTAAGEFLYGGLGKAGDIGAVTTSTGSTQLSTADAQRLYGLLQVGDVVLYPNASGPVVAPSDGYGDWNLSWTTWTAGGLIKAS